MNNPVKLSVGVVFGLICGAMIGTIIGSAYLTLALWRGVAGFDMFSVWTASEVMRAMHPEAFKVAFGAVALFALGLGFLAFVWSWRKQRDESPRVYRRVKLSKDEPYDPKKTYPDLHARISRSRRSTLRRSRAMSQPLP